MNLKVDPKNYKMPLPHRGQIVLWYENGVQEESRACAAVVKVENHSSVHLKVFGIDNDFDVTCSRHVSDPNAKDYDRINEGGWDFCIPDRTPREAVRSEPVSGLSPNKLK